MPLLSITKPSTRDSSLQSTPGRSRHSLFTFAISLYVQVALSAYLTVLARSCLSAFCLRLRHPSWIVQFHLQAHAQGSRSPTPSTMPASLVFRPQHTTSPTSSVRQRRRSYLTRCVRHRSPEIDMFKCVACRRDDPDGSQSPRSPARPSHAGSSSRTDDYRPGRPILSKTDFLTRLSLPGSMSLLFRDCSRFHLLLMNLPISSPQARTNGQIMS